jgi:hypothetical protein
MKTLILGIVVILLIGLGGFFYRNVAERSGAPEQVACTADAKLCPDGSAALRAPPSCEFTACAFPNVEIPEAGIAFAVPAGYAADENAYGADPSMIAAFVKPSLSGNPPHTITIRRFHVADGQTADEVTLANTRYQPADMNAENFSRFKTTLINGRTYRYTVIERFEALVQSAYYLVRANDVLVFTVTEHDVVEWTNPDLVVEELPEHQALLSLLSTLQTP